MDKELQQKMQQPQPDNEENPTVMQELNQHQTEILPDQIPPGTTRKIVAAPTDAEPQQLNKIRLDGEEPTNTLHCPVQLTTHKPHRKPECSLRNVHWWQWKNSQLIP